MSLSHKVEIECGKCGHVAEVSPNKIPGLEEAFADRASEAAAEARRDIFDDMMGEQNNQMRRNWRDLAEAIRQGDRQAAEWAMDALTANYPALQHNVMLGRFSAKHASSESAQFGFELRMGEPA